MFRLSSINDTDAVTDSLESDDLEALTKTVLKKIKNGEQKLALFYNNSLLFCENMLLISPLIENALNLALKYHAGVKRKGDGLPYLIHILDVSNGLYENGKNILDPDVLAAAFCHDLLEDTDCTEEEIINACNEEVLRIVKAVSADDSIENWKEKKQDYIESVRAGGVKAQLVCVADKIANLNSLKNQYDIEGDVIWQKFNADKKTKAWFEYSVLKMLKEENHVPEKMLQTYEDTLQSVYHPS